MKTNKVKKYTLKEGINVNPTQKLAMEAMADWLSNDPDPNGTLNKIKKDNARKRSLSKNNPIKLLKEELTPQEFRDFFMDLADLRTYYAIEYYKKGKKIKTTDFASLYYLPTVIYNHNFKYWKTLIQEYRFYEHPEFMVVPPEMIEGFERVEKIKKVSVDELNKVTK